MLRDLLLASETICDKEAARRTGNVQTVIGAVNAVMRLNRPVVESLGAAFIQIKNDDSPFEDLTCRIRELLDESKTRLPNFVLSGTTLIIYAYSVVALTEATHHIAEYFLS
jgi:hypothetical protein